MNPPAASWRFDAIGTRWQIDSAAVLDDTARARIGALIDGFDREWSRFRPDSLVSALAARGGEVRAPVDATPMLDLYADLSDATAGAVNPLVGEALARRGYDAEYSLVDRGAVPAPTAWRELVGWHSGILRVAEAVTLDVGALGKGRLVDRVAALVRALVPGGVTVDAGGDLAVRGRTERVALEHPYDPTRAVGVWEIADAALCASAVNRRAWPGRDGEGLHHVLDARTGRPVQTVAATWASALDALTADAVATALFFDGGPEFAARHGADWVRMATDGSIEWSPDCSATLFIRR